jgi:hypothetical protein
VLGGAITFFDVKPEDMEIIEETLEQYAHFHDARQERDES